MTKKLFSICLTLFGLSIIAQTPRMCLYEEFTGETCPPCASANPALNALLLNTNNINKVVAIKWQVPIPSAPTKTWSLYQTNKAEINWRYSSYGYGINSAPSGRMDGRNVTAFGATSDHPNALNNTVINTAQANSSAFSVTMQREWSLGCSAVIVTVNIQASANFTAVGNLFFRTVMVERVIDFSVQPGTNGEKHFEDVAIKCFPSTSGTSMVKNWVIGQTHSFTLNCPIPAYTRLKSEIAMVGFIQDDGNRRVEQAVRADKVSVPVDNLATLGATATALTCNNAITPIVSIRNDGPNAVTAMTLTPYNDGIAGTPFSWTGNLAVGVSTNITFNSITTPSITGTHLFTFNVTLPTSNYNLTANSNSTSYYVAASYIGVPVSEGFIGTVYPPANWGVINKDNGAGNWSKVSSPGVGGYGYSDECTKYDFFNNLAIGDVDELYLPPMNLSISMDTPTLTFEWCYAQRISTSDDKLEFMVSDNCGSTWTTLFSQHGSGLVTVPSPISSAFTPPQDITIWQTASAVLTGFINKPNVISKFVVTNDHGNNLFIDNVNLSQIPDGISKSTKNNSAITIFPNPVNNFANVKYVSATTSNLKVSVVNAIGAEVYSKNLRAETGTNVIHIDTKDFSSGVYYVKIESNNSIATKKIIVVK